MKSVFVFFALLIMTCPAFGGDNVVIMFDTSGSMSETMASGKSRLQVAQAALISVLSKVPPTTKVGVITFQGWLFDLQEVNHAELAKGIASIQNGGGTPLYRFTIQGANRLLQEREKQGNVGFYKLLVVTDGAADYDDQGFNEDGTFADGSFRPGALKDIIGRGITVDAIGLDMDEDHALKTQINGKYMRGDNPDNIEKSLQASVAEVGFDNKDVGDAFQEISELPEGFVTASIQGLTEFHNHGIGEQPLVPVVENGVLKYVGRPAIPAGATTSLGFLLFIGTIFAIFAIVGFTVLFSR